MTSTRDWGLDNPEKVKDPTGGMTRGLDIQPVLWWQTIDSNQPKVGDHIILYRSGAGDLKRCFVSAVEQRLCKSVVQRTVMTSVVVELVGGHSSYTLGPDDLWIPDTLPKEQ